MENGNLQGSIGGFGLGFGFKSPCDFPPLLLHLLESGPGRMGRVAVKEWMAAIFGVWWVLGIVERLVEV